MWPSVPVAPGRSLNWLLRPHCAEREGSRGRPLLSRFRNWESETKIFPLVRERKGGTVSPVGVPAAASDGTLSCRPRGRPGHAGLWPPRGSLSTRVRWCYVRNVLLKTLFKLWSRRRDVKRAVSSIFKCAARQCDVCSRSCATGPQNSPSSETLSPSQPTPQFPPRQSPLPACDSDDARG